MKIGVDLDGVCYDFTQAFCDYVGRPNTATTWEFYKDWGWTTEEFLTACSHAIEGGVMFRHGYVIPGAVEGLKALNDAGHLIYFVTDRASLDPNHRSAIIDATRAWLDDNDIRFGSLIFDGDKARVAKEHDLGFFLDDKIENYEDVVCHTKAFLFDQPWNRVEGGKSDPYARIEDWNHFVGLVNLTDAVGRMKQAEQEVRVTSATGGQKGQKLARVGSLDPEALLKVAEVAGFGERKYSRLNYMNGYDWSLTFDAGMRHRLAFWNGEDLDPESGLPHLAHAAWHDLCLLTFFLKGLGTDDRYVRPEDVA